VDRLVLALDLHRVVSDEARVAGQQPDPVAPELLAGDRRLGRDHRRGAVHQLLDRLALGVLHPRRVQHVERPRGQLLEHGLTQRLGRDRPRVDGDAAQPVPALRHGHALAQLGGLDGGPLATRPRADDEKIELHGLESSGVFDSLSEKLQGTLAGVRQRGALTEDDINKAMREIRLALLEADVNFKVVKQFTSTVKERALGSDVAKQLNPGQQVVKIVNEELAALMGGQSAGITFSPRPPTVILMAGLQGSGKTTATAKLAKLLAEQNRSSVAVAACDVYRPAAVEQLVKVGTQAGATVYEQGTDRNPVDIAGWALDQAKRDGKDVLIVDTSGRLHVDQALMQELADIKKRIRPHVVLLVVDAMTGQDAVNVAEQFAEVAQFDGVVLSKLDGDARGGAALSVKAVTGKPILFASTGEKLGDFERFHPDRMAQRILGMGDVLSFIERAEQQVDEDEAKELERKLRKNQFTLEDFLGQLKKIRRMGPLTSLLGMIPGFAGHQLSKLQVDEKELDRVEAIVLSMTPYERRHPELIKGSRRVRIAKGSGTSVQQVNQLVKQFDQMRKLMRGIQQGKMPDLGQLMRQR
jgi:signal recognition particle subunit SRP54